MDQMGQMGGRRTGTFGRIFLYFSRLEASSRIMAFAPATNTKPRGRVSSAHCPPMESATPPPAVLHAGSVGGWCVFSRMFVTATVYAAIIDYHQWLWPHSSGAGRSCLPEWLHLYAICSGVSVG